MRKALPASAMPPGTHIAMPVIAFRGYNRKWRREEKNNDSSENTTNSKILIETAFSKAQILLLRTYFGPLVTYVPEMRSQKEHYVYRTQGRPQLSFY